MEQPGALPGAHGVRLPPRQRVFMNRLHSQLPRGQYFAIHPSPGVPEQFTLIYHLNMGGAGPLPEDSPLRYTQENIDEFCDSRANIRTRFPNLLVLERNSPQNYRVDRQDCLFASYRDEIVGPGELLDGNGAPISVHSQLFPLSPASFLSPGEAQRKRPAPTLSATISNSSSSSSSSRTPKSSRRDSSSTQISKRGVLATDGPGAAAATMNEALGSLRRGTEREAALASFHELPTPEDKRHMQRACAAVLPGSLADQMNEVVVSELNKVRAHLSGLGSRIRKKKEKKGHAPRKTQTPAQRPTPSEWPSPPTQAWSRATSSAWLWQSMENMLFFGNGG